MSCQSLGRPRPKTVMERLVERVGERPGEVERGQATSQAVVNELLEASERRDFAFAALQRTLDRQFSAICRVSEGLQSLRAALAVQPGAAGDEAAAAGLSIELSRTRNHLGGIFERVVRLEDEVSALRIETQQLGTFATSSPHDANIAQPEAVA